jgi:hypothetical protein
VRARIVCGDGRGETGAARAEDDDSFWVLHAAFSAAGRGGQAKGKPDHTSWRGYRVDPRPAAAAPVSVGIPEEAVS